ncbi:MAG: hypothetical protein RLZZ522_1016 [Verrucomicrobiota bacterium]
MTSGLFRRRGQEKHFGLNKSGGLRSATTEMKSDLEAFEGTCYKAADWQPSGITSQEVTRPGPQIFERCFVAQSSRLGIPAQGRP